MSIKRILFVLALCAVGFTLFCCGGSDEEAAASEIPIEDILARERAAAHFNAGERRNFAARKELAPLVAREDAKLDDLVHAGAIEVGDGEYEAAESSLARAFALEPSDPRIAYMRGRIAYNSGHTEEALIQFELALAGAPADLPSLLSLGEALLVLGEDERAVELLQQIIEVGIADGGSWYFAAVYKLGRYYGEIGADELIERYRDLSAQLVNEGFKAPEAWQVDRGNLGGFPPPAASGSRLSTPTGPPAFASSDPILPEIGGATAFSLHDMNGDRLIDVLAWGESGVFVCLQGYEGWRVFTIQTETAQQAIAFDLDNDDDLDILVADTNSVRLHESIGRFELEEWHELEGRLPAAPGAIRSILPLDSDHEGDLDLLLVGAFGVRHWRNDGAKEEGGSFTDTTTEAGFPDTGELDWCVSEDYDSDQDVDILLGGKAETFLMSNLRGGRFEDITAKELGAQTRFAAQPVVADFDGDARPDLLTESPVDASWTMWTKRAEYGYEQEQVDMGLPARCKPVQADLDLDGSLDLIWITSDQRCAGVLAAGTKVQKSFEIGNLELGASFAVADIDRDCDNDLLYLDQAGLHIYLAEFEGMRATGLEWIGIKDNRRAIGAICEVRIGGVYRRIYWRGKSELIGLGDVQLVDIVRVTWPNGVVQTELDIEPCYMPIDPDGKGPFAQKEGLIGSCPFLYTWNGAEYEFISDVLGITPLGLPMGPGMLVPPDHDEYVLVRGDQLAPKDGVLSLQFTEELREVTYLDRIRLDVIDHPLGSEIMPDERFCFPPFPPAHTHTLQDPLPPTRAMGSDGSDWAASLATVDDQHAIPFEPLHGQFLGLATPHWLELEFDPERVAQAKKLRLIFTGWFYWTDASVNMAAARTPGVDFVPPLLQVPDGQGGWRDTGPPIGFPAGKTKSMVIDVTDLISREDPRLRLFSTLRLYWDRIALAVDDDDAELRVTQLEPKKAHLWRRGFSAAFESERADLPERFDFEVLTTAARWNQHPGLYTRLGDVLPLLTAVEDQYVIMGSGDALEVQFDASELPPLADGFVRDYLVYLDGWAKDRDPNSIQALEVEPLPFHGMSAYPYRDDEHFPDSEAHQSWRREWNTRAAYEQVVPISPSRQVDWLLGAAKP